MTCTRDNPGDALVLKQNYNLEKMAEFEYFTTGAKIMGNTASFISVYWKHQDNTNNFFYCCQPIKLQTIVEPRYY